jgi:hypothetical protein
VYILYRENIEALAVASKENGLDVNVDKTKYMAISRNKNAARSHNINIDSNSFAGGGRVQIFGNKLNQSNLYSGSN